MVPTGRANARPTAGSVPDPELSRFSGVQLHTIVRCCAPSRNDEQTSHRGGIDIPGQWSPSKLVYSVDTAPPSRRSFRARYAVEFPPSTSEGAGNAGRLVRPQPRVVVENTRVSHHGHTGFTRHSPRNGFNGFLRALLGDRAFLSPSPARCEASSPRLMPASRRQDHTTSPSATAPFVKGASASTASRSTSVTIAKRPSLSRRDGASW